MTIDKRAYKAPAASRIGTFEEITQGNSGGFTTDAALPSNTPLSQIPAFVATHTS